MSARACSGSQGILNAGAFVLFLSKGVLARDFCQYEIREALAAEKPMVLVHGELG